MSIVRVTEKKTVKVDGACKESPVYITWLNVYGGREHWLFSKVQTKGLITQNNGSSETYVSNISTARGFRNDISKIARPLLTVNAMVDIEDIEGIKTLLYSPSVEMLVGQDPVKWQTVYPQVGSFSLYNTRQTKATIEITFELADINIQG